MVVTGDRVITVVEHLLRGVYQPRDKDIVNLPPDAGMPSKSGSG
jgi:hypothetical protein